MALIMSRGGASSVSTTTKHSILADIQYLIEKVTKVAQGDVKFLDANMKQTSAALKRLQEAKGYLDQGLIPTNEE